MTRAAHAQGAPRARGAAETVAPFGSPSRGPGSVSARVPARGSVRGPAGPVGLAGDEVVVVVGGPLPEFWVWLALTVAAVPGALGAFHAVGVGGVLAVGGGYVAATVAAMRRVDSTRAPGLTAAAGRLGQQRHRTDRGSSELLAAGAGLPRRGEPARLLAVAPGEGRAGSSSLTGSSRSWSLAAGGIAGGALPAGLVRVVWVQVVAAAGGRCECTRPACHGPGRCTATGGGGHRLLAAPVDGRPLPPGTGWVQAGDLTAWCASCLTAAAAPPSTTRPVQENR